MKKLLITTMAAVSVGLCAKAADDGFISGTSFETVLEKSYLATNGVTTLCEWYDKDGNVLSNNDSADPELGSRYWMTEAADAQLVVSNVTNFAGDYLSNNNRPLKWSSDENSKALYIDTDKPLMRYVDRSVDDRQAKGVDLNQDIFFDSVVQFTATDVAAEPDSADKLRVWLYTSPDDVATTPGLFKETTPKTCLVVTAGKYEGDLSISNLKAEHYEVQIDGVELQPDTWHRLTIKAIADIDPTEYATPGFEIWVDGKPVTYGADKKTQFPSLKEAETSGKETLQCVAFDGKGAVDDIVFTTTAPDFAKEDQAVEYTFTLNFSENVEIKTFEINGVSYKPVSSGESYEVAVDNEIYLSVAPANGYTLTFDVDDGKFNKTEFGDYEYSFTPSNAGSGTVTIIATQGGGANPTVGGVEVVVDANGKITNITTADNGKAVTGTITDDMFADYYDVSVDTDGKLVIAIDPSVATPAIDETAADKGDAIVVTETEVALGVTNAKVGLWYGAQAYSDAACTTKIGDEPTGWEKATDTTVTVTAEKPDAGTAFFKVVVDDQDHTPAEEQE